MHDKLERIRGEAGVTYLEELIRHLLEKLRTTTKNLNHYNRRLLGDKPNTSQKYYRLTQLRSTI